MAKLKFKKREITFLKPEQLDIDKLMKENEQECAVKRIRSFQLEFIIDALLRSRISNRRLMEDKHTTYAPLCAELLQSVVNNYSHYLRFLIDKGIIISDGHYLPGIKCTGFALAQPYHSQLLVECVVDDYRLRKAVRRQRAYIKEKHAETTYGYKYLTRHWETSKLDIDQDKCFEWIEEHTRQKIQAIPVSYTKKIRAEKADLKRATSEDFKQHVKRIKEKDYSYHFFRPGPSILQSHQ